MDSLEAIIAVADVAERTLYRVVVGPYSDRDQTHAGLGVLKEYGIDDVQVLNRLPGTVQQRDEIVDEAPSGAPADDVANEYSNRAESSPSLSYAESL